MVCIALLATNVIMNQRKNCLSFHIDIHCISTGISAPNFPDPDTVITVLKLSQLSPVTTVEEIMDYISTKTDDDVEVKSVTLLGGGNAKASVSGFTGNNIIN